MYRLLFLDYRLLFIDYSDLYIYIYIYIDLFIEKNHLIYLLLHGHTNQIYAKGLYHIHKITAFHPSLEKSINILRLFLGAN